MHNLPLILVDTEFDYVFGYKLIKKSDGKEYASVTTSESDFTAKTAQFHLENLFNGNKALGTSLLLMRENFVQMVICLQTFR